MKVIRFLDGDNCGCAEVDFLTKEMQDNGFYELVEGEYPERPTDDYLIGSNYPTYTLDDGKVYESWEYALDRNKIKRQIEIVKKQLSDTDYAFIKRAEYDKVGKKNKHEDSYYEELSDQRDQWREKVNYLSSLLI